MSYDISFFGRARIDAPIRELSRIALKSDTQTDEGQTLPAGSQGTIVATWEGGTGYEVEFTKPFAALVYVEPEDFDVIETAPPG